MKNSLNFDELINEMELIDKSESHRILGGGGDPNAVDLSNPNDIDNSGFRPGGGGGSVYRDGTMDCVFQSVAFATGRSTRDIQTEYTDYYNKQVDANNWNPLWHANFDTIGELGVSIENINAFLNQYGLISGYTPSAPNGYSGVNGAGIILVNGHAYNITGMASPFEYYTYDPQQNKTDRISINDSRIVGVYSREQNAPYIN